MSVRIHGSVEPMRMCALTTEYKLDTWIHVFPLGSYFLFFVCSIEYTLSVVYEPFRIKSFVYAEHAIDEKIKEKNEENKHKENQRKRINIRTKSRWWKERQPQLESSFIKKKFGCTRLSDCLGFEIYFFSTSTRIFQHETCIASEEHSNTNSLYPHLPICPEWFVCYTTMLYCTWTGRHSHFFFFVL